jgi:hypothetical protein
MAKDLSAEKSNVRVDPEETDTRPRDSLELQLTSIWEILLDNKTIGTKDNFFDLGGNTLLVRRLLADIKEILGKEIALSTFFQAQTIQELAKVLQQDRWSARRPPIVMLQRGRSTAPLFIIFPGYHIADLVRHLGPDQTVYGILQLGLDGKASQDTKIRDMATKCIKEIVSLQPEGPYLLAGRCIGGLGHSKLPSNSKRKVRESPCSSCSTLPLPSI